MSILELSRIVGNAPSLKPSIEKVEKADTLSSLVLATLWLTRALAVLIIESELNRRAKLPTSWPKCPVFGRKLEGKGFLRCSILTMVGMIHWKRRVGRCPTKGCSGQQSAPFDGVLGIVPYQQTSDELKN